MLKVSLLQAAKNKITLCLQRIKQQKEKEKKTFANMFDKFAEIDKKKEAKVILPCAVKRQGRCVDNLCLQERLGKPDAMNNIDQWSSGGDNGISTDPNSIKVTSITTPVAAEPRSTEGGRGYQDGSRPERGDQGGRGAAGGGTVSGR